MTGGTSFHWLFVYSVHNYTCRQCHNLDSFCGEDSEAIFRPLCKHNSMLMSTAVSDSGGRKRTLWMCRVYLTMLTHSLHKDMYI